MNEASYMLNSGSEEDFTRHAGADAMSEKIREWLDTPEGSVAHNPSWGHNLMQFKHDPLSRDLEFQITLAINKKLPLDIEDIALRGLRVEFVGIDMFKLEILYKFGNGTFEIKL